MVDNASIYNDWIKIARRHPSIPSSLHVHQADAMALLKQRKHVLLGTYQFSHMLFISV